MTFTPTDTTNYTSVSGDGDVTVNAASAAVVLSNLTQAYTGSPLYPTATTSPAGLAITWANAPQTNAGSYSVTATINDFELHGGGVGDLRDHPGDAECDGLADGECDHLRAGAVGLDVEWRQCDGGGELRVHGAFDGAGRGGDLQRGGDLHADGHDQLHQRERQRQCDGERGERVGGFEQPDPGLHGQSADPTATTSPAGLAITWANAPQTNAGSYSVTATINDSSYTGAGRGPS